jgi:hypothetical protein
VILEKNNGWNQKVSQLSFYLAEKCYKDDESERERERETGQLTGNSTNMVINDSLDKPETITAHIRKKSK